MEPTSFHCKIKNLIYMNEAQIRVVNYDTKLWNDFLNILNNHLLVYAVKTFLATSRNKVLVSKRSCSSRNTVKKKPRSVNFCQNRRL